LEVLLKSKVVATLGPREGHWLSALLLHAGGDDVEVPLTLYGVGVEDMGEECDNTHHAGVLTGFLKALLRHNLGDLWGDAVLFHLGGCELDDAWSVTWSVVVFW
jgi:hypothetical protein